MVERFRIRLRGWRDEADRYIESREDTFRFELIRRLQVLANAPRRNDILHPVPGIDTDGIGDVLVILHDESAVCGYMTGIVCTHC